MHNLFVICGASGDIGSSIAEALVAEDSILVLHYYKNLDAVTRLKAKLDGMCLQILIYQADLTREEEVDRFAKWVDASFYNAKIHLINAQGSCYFSLCQDVSTSEWNEVLALNLSSYFYTCRAFLPLFIRQKSSAIVNISSMWGLSGSAMESAYSAAKAGVIQFSKSLAKELGPSNIRVNVVAPGVIEGHMNASLSNETLRELADNTSLMRLGKPAEIASVVRFLLSEESAYITGQCLLVDGGFLYN